MPATLHRDQLGYVVLSDSNGVSFGAAGLTITASGAGGAADGGVFASAAGNSITAGTLVFSNSNNVSFGMAGSTITATATNPGGAADGINRIAADTRTAPLTATVLFSNANGLSFGLDAGASTIMTASHNALTSQSNQAASASNGSFTFQTVAFSNANNVTFGTSAGSIITASVAAPGGGAAPQISLWPIPGHFGWAGTAPNLVTTASTGGSTQFTASCYAWSMPFPHDLHGSVLYGLNSIAATSAGTGSASHGHLFGVYTLNAGTALSLLSSFMFVHEITQNSITARTHRFYWGSNSTSNSTQIAGNVSASFSGMRKFPLYSSGFTLSASNYYFVQMASTRSSNANIHSMAQIAYASATNTTMASMIGNISYERPYGFGGVFTTTTNTNVMTGLALPGSIHTSVFTVTATSMIRVPYVVAFRNS